MYQGGSRINPKYISKLKNDRKNVWIIIAIKNQEKPLENSRKYPETTRKPPQNHHIGCMALFQL